VGVPRTGEVVEVFFTLEGRLEGTFSVEVSPLDHNGGVARARTPELFSVTRSPTPSAPPQMGVPPLAVATPPWVRRITDRGERRVLVHILEHGSISEAEVNTILGSPRLARLFASRLEVLQDVIPFTISVETTGSGKRYFRTREK
jgi:hypothetical protein